MRSPDLAKDAPMRGISLKTTTPPAEINQGRLVALPPHSVNSQDQEAGAMPFFDSDGLKIHYEDRGSGDPAVLVHGFASNAQNNWGITGWLD